MGQNIEQNQYLHKQKTRYIPCDGGFTSIHFVRNVHPDHVILQTGSRTTSAWPLPDGSFTTVRTTPHDWYKLTVNGYVPSKFGHFTIIGKFPNYRCEETGHTVWLDFDGTMKLYPIDFVGRCDEQLRLDNFNRKFQPPKQSVKRKMKRCVVVKRYDGNFDWRVMGKSGVLANGIEPTRKDGMFEAKKMWNRLRQRIHRNGE